MTHRVTHWLLSVHMCYDRSVGSSAARIPARGTRPVEYAHSSGPGRGSRSMLRMDNIPQPKVTAAFYAQAVAAFALGLIFLAVGIFYLPVGGWIRAFLAVGLLYVVTSAFTLAKTVRDAQDAGTVVRRVDQARIDKLINEHDPFKVPSIP